MSGNRNEWRGIAALIFDTCLPAAIGIGAALAIIEFINLWRLP